jgi:phenylalanyl-tRNA synthetase beta chain
MKFTLSWLKEHLDTKASLEEITETLSRIGLEVEDVHNPAERLAPFRIAHVVEAKQHPDADRLRVCMVDTGEGAPVQVVCGAPNARTGIKGVFAPPGTHIPGTGLDLKPGVIRGQQSNGMLCSERELQLSQEHDGIIELPEDAPVGAPYAQWAGLDDPVIEIAVTPNRGDALSVAGVARDLSAAGLGTFLDKRADPVPGRFSCPVNVTLDLPGEAAKNCPAFALRLVRGVRNGPSPDWLQNRLKEIGLRPIDALVDITNYMTYDRGRPLHVFDAAKVEGDLVVRLARQGETLLALDGRTYALDESMTVIADATGPESIAGIMGGEETGVTETTTDVLIESALWDPIDIAETGRALSIHSDARYRFERGVDPSFTIPGLEMATRLVLDFCGGEPSEITLAGEIPEPEHIIDFDPKEVSRLAGIGVPWAEAKAILDRLGFWTVGREAPYRVAIPGRRPDVSMAADLVEEIVRIVGVDRVPSTPLPKLDAVPRPVLNLGQKRERSAKRLLAARGLVEAITWSFIPETQAQLFGGGTPNLVLDNPISSELSTMRPSLLPGLVAAAQRNADRGSPDLALFEVGQVFAGDAPEDQKRIAAGLRRATAKPNGAGRHWSGNAGPVDAFDAKADAMALLADLGAPVDKLQTTRDAPGWYHPGRSGTLRLGPKLALAHFGELHPAALKALDAQGPVVAFELFLDALPEPKAKPTRAKPALQASDLMPVTRDFAFLLDREVEAERVLRAATGADKALIAKVEVFDVYEGDRLPADKKSLAIAVTLQPRGKTLTDEEIDAVAGRIVGAVEKATGAQLRG